jgi:copper(I)-binding protein
MSIRLRTAIGLLLLGTLPAAWSGPASLTVDNAWIAEAPPGVGVNAGYLTIGNGGDRERVLERVTSPGFARVEMHRTVVSADGTSRMQRQQEIAIPAGARFEFSPGGYHLMLFEKREPVRSGDRIGLTLHFADGTLLKTSAPVRRMDGHSHH